MIRVIQQPEPKSFIHRVEVPGNKFLTGSPTPLEKEWKSHAYWVRVLPDLYRAFGGVCSFSCHWIPPQSGRSVEHFKPKKKYPQLAYKWSNFRLMCMTLNGRKKDYEDVIDPFQVDDDMFVLDFPSLLVKPAPALKPAVLKRVQDTIDRLKLNDEGTCLSTREAWLRPYCEGHVDWDYLKSKAPFIARELERQNLVTDIRTVMSYSTQSSFSPQPPTPKAAKNPK